MKTVYQTNDSNVLVHALQIAEQPGYGYCLPFGAVEVAPPASADGKAVRWSSGTPRSMPDFGLSGTGSWEQEKDYRNVPLYLTQSGQRYAIGQEVDGVAFDGVGELPAWLTETAWPGEFFVWNGIAWQLDEDARHTALAESERAWRDAEIARTDFLLLPDYPLDDERRQALSEYRVFLRDWPAHPLFPDQSARPVAPEWLASWL